MEAAGQQHISRLLIVEDDHAQRRTLTDVMRAEGFEVLCCGTAVEALQHFEQGGFEVAIVDLRLPDLPGGKLLEKMRAMSDQVRVIIHTGYGSFDSAKTAVNLGAFAYVEKLSDPAELIGHVHRAFQERLRFYADGLEDEIAGRKRVEEELRNMERTLRFIVEGTSTAVTGCEFFRSLVRDLAGALRVRFASLVELADGANETVQTRALWANDDFAENLRYPMAGTPCEHVVEQGICHYPERVQEQFPEDLWLRDRDVESYLGVRLNTSSGETLGLLCVLHDKPLPDPSMARSVLSIFATRAAAELERERIEERSRRDQAMLAHASRLASMGEMASNLAHELNQPLGAIRTYSDASKRMVDPARLGELAATVDKIGGQAQRAGEIIRRMRDFVRKRPSHSLPIDINRVIREAVDMVATGARLGGITISLGLSDRLPPVQGDAIQLQQVIVNLIRNGCEAMSQTTSDDAMLSIHSTVAEDGFVVVRVRDGGIGLGDEPTRDLFEPFFSTKPDGMGLGLSISRSIVEAHGGKLRVMPNRERGATFHLMLPVKEGVRNGND